MNIYCFITLPIVMLYVHLIDYHSLKLVDFEKLLEHYEIRYEFLVIFASKRIMN